MKVLVDTPIWSAALRRRPSAQASPLISELASLIHDGRAVLAGAVRQEILSGIREREQFDVLAERLRAFADAEIATVDYEVAASFYNRCRAKGIQGSNTDYLLCAIAVRNDYSIFTTDTDFEHFSRVLPIRTHSVP